MTPAESKALIERWKFKHRINNYNVALICATLANINRDPKSSQSFKPGDFMNPLFQPAQRRTPDWGVKMRQWAEARIRAQERRDKQKGDHL